MIGIEAVDSADAIGDVLKIVLGEQPAESQEHGCPGVLGGESKGTEWLEGDDHLHARIDRGPANADRGPVGDSDDSDLAGDQSAALQRVENLGQVMGFVTAVADVVAGGASMPAKVDEDDAVSLAGQAAGNRIRMEHFPWCRPGHEGERSVPLAWRSASKRGLGLRAHASCATTGRRVGMDRESSDRNAGVEMELTIQTERRSVGGSDIHAKLLGDVVLDQHGFRGIEAAGRRIDVGGASEFFSNVVVAARRHHWNNQDEQNAENVAAAISKITKEVGRR